MCEKHNNNRTTLSRLGIAAVILTLLELGVVAYISWTRKNPENNVKEMVNTTHVEKKKPNKNENKSEEKQKTSNLKNNEILNFRIFFPFTFEFICKDSQHTLFLNDVLRC